MLIQFVTWGFVNEHVLFGDAYIEGSKTLVRGVLGYPNEDFSYRWCHS